MVFVGDMTSGLEPRVIESLCKKGIVGVAYGSGPHVLAFTSGK